MEGKSAHISNAWEEAILSIAISTENMIARFIKRPYLKKTHPTITLQSIVPRKLIVMSCMWCFLVFFVTFPYVVLSQVWYLIVSIPNVCLLSYLFANYMLVLILYLIEMPFNTFANRADPDQAALVRAAWSGSMLFAHRNRIFLILHQCTLQVFSLFYVQIWKFIYIIIHSGWSLARIFMTEKVN